MCPGSARKVQAPGGTTCCQERMALTSWGSGLGTCMMGGSRRQRRWVCLWMGALARHHSGVCDCLLPHGDFSGNPLSELFLGKVPLAPNCGEHLVSGSPSLRAIVTQGEGRKGNPLGSPRRLGGPEVTLAVAGALAAVQLASWDWAGCGWQLWFGRLAQKELPRASQLEQGWWPVSHGWKGSPSLR